MTEMGSTKFSVEAGSLTTHAGNLQTSSGTFKGHAAALLAALDTVSSWEGDSKSAFKGMSDQMHSTITGLVGALENLSGRISSSNNTYNSGQEQQTAAINSANGGAEWSSAVFRA